MLRASMFFLVLFSFFSFFSGIPVPVGFDQAHVMYVWFDALTNYLTGIHALVRGWCVRNRDAHFEGEGG